MSWWFPAKYEFPRCHEKHSCCFAYPTCINRGMQIFCWNKQLGPSVTKPLWTFSDGSIIFSNHTRIWNRYVSSTCLCIQIIQKHHLQASQNLTWIHKKASFWNKTMLYETITLTLRLANMAGWKMYQETEHPIPFKRLVNRGIFRGFPQATPANPFNHLRSFVASKFFWNVQKTNVAPPKRWRFGFRYMAIFSWTPWHPPPRAALPCALAGSNSFCQTSHLWKTGELYWEG